MKVYLNPVVIKFAANFANQKDEEISSCSPTDSNPCSVNATLPKSENIKSLISCEYLSPIGICILPRSKSIANPGQPVYKSY